jgi:hypothetical protein
MQNLSFEKNRLTHINSVSEVCMHLKTFSNHRSRRINFLLNI